MSENIEEIEKKENEQQETIKVFVRDTLTLIQLGTALYGPFGVSRFNTEEEVKERVQTLSVHEVQTFDVELNHYDALLEFATKYFALRIYAGKFVLFVEDKKYPEYNWVQKFNITSEEATKLLKHVISHAEKISFDL